jgi:aminopeptidase N
MWFGNLVTMEWFNDVWMKEVFSNFMAAKIVNPSFPEIDHELRFLLAHYPTAYGVDRTDGANAIRQELSNLNEAGTLYGAIIYQKAPVVMKHLELLMGEEPFRDGVREYLDRYRFGNATWPDLVTILDEKTKEDLAGWSNVWVEEPRRPTITTHLELEGRAVRGLTIAQEDPEGRDRRWNQRLEVLLGYEGGEVKTFSAHLKEASVEVRTAGNLPAPDYVLPNGLGIGYGYFELDERSREYLLNNVSRLPSPLTRAVAWLSLWEALLAGSVPPLEMTELIRSSLETETDELNIERLLRYLERTYWAYLGADQRNNLASPIENLLWQSIEEASRETLKAAYFAAYRRMALSEKALARLQRIWEKSEEVPGLSLAERDYSAIAQALAVREVPDAESILEQQLARIENPDRKVRFRFAMPFLSPDRNVRDQYFNTLKDAGNRHHEPWVLDAVGFLNHPLRAEEAEHHIRPSLDLLEEIQRTGDIFFPKRWLDATLTGHSSPSAAAIVQEFLDERDDLPPRLRQKLLQSADPLFRAAKMKGS